MNTIPESAWIPISALNHYAFCPRRCYYIHVEQVFIENHFTLQGHANHHKVHQEHTEAFTGGEAHYQMYLYSRHIGLYGQGDKVEISESEIAPIEYKSGERKRWQNDRLQLCAQALCLEEMFETTVERGFLYYHKSRRREEVAMDAKLRRQTTAILQDVRKLFREKYRPESTYHKRCDGCSFQPTCLPEETARLKQYGAAKGKDS